MARPEKRKGIKGAWSATVICFLVAAIVIIIGYTINDMFESNEYIRCNEIRRRFYETHGIDRLSVYKEDKENRRSYIKKECT